MVISIWHLATKGLAIGFGQDVFDTANRGAVPPAGAAVSFCGVRF